MKTKDAERNFHREAMKWKIILQETETVLEGIQKNASASELHVGRHGTEHYSEKIKQLKQRVSTFENRLSLLNECDTSQCDVAFFEEADSISKLVRDCRELVNNLS